MKVTTHLHLVTSLRMSGATPLLPLYASTACTATTVLQFRFSLKHIARYFKHSHFLTEFISVLVQLHYFIRQLSFATLCPLVRSIKVVLSPDRSCTQQRRAVTNIAVRQGRDSSLGSLCLEIKYQHVTYFLLLIGLVAACVETVF